MFFLPSEADPSATGTTPGSHQVPGVSLRHPVRLVTGVESAHRDQVQPEVTDLAQHPVQCGLVGKQAKDDRVRAVGADLETAEPVRPLVVENAVDADLVTDVPALAAHARSPRSPRNRPSARLMP